MSIEFGIAAMSAIICVLTFVSTQFQQTRTATREEVRDQMAVLKERLAAVERLMTQCDDERAALQRENIELLRKIAKTGQ